MSCKNAFLSAAAELLRLLRHERRCAFCAAPFLPAPARLPEPAILPDPATLPASAVLPAPAALPAPASPPGVCPDCLQRLAASLPDSPLMAAMDICPRCGGLVAAVPGSSPLCGACLTGPPPWEALYFYGFYQGYLRRLLLRLKFGQALHLAEALGLLLAARPELRARTRLWDCLLPMPLHPARLRERGFNQAALLAAPLARRQKLPLRPDLLRRVVDSAHQTGLSRSQRQRNTRNIFAPSPQVRGKSILLLDDVMTTGATLRSAASCLIGAGAARVDVAVLARTAGRNWRV